jgi:hypothetical protein
MNRPGLRVLFTVLLSPAPWSSLRHRRPAPQSVPGPGADNMNGGSDIDALAGPAGDGPEDTLSGGGDDGLDDFCSETEGDIEDCS